MISITIFTALLAASLAAPGQCFRPAFKAEEPSTSVTSSSFSTIRRNGHGNSGNSALTFPPGPAVVDIATFTGTVPKPTQTLSCDSSLGKIIRADNGKGYSLACNFQFPGNDLYQLHAADWATCMEACSVAVGCKAFEFHSNVANENCNLKTAGDPETWDIGDNIWIGWEVSSQLKPTPTTTTTTLPTDTSLKTVQITPLPTPIAPLQFNPDPNHYDKTCYPCGLNSPRETIIPAVQFFCENDTLGTYYPDRLMQSGDSISLEYSDGFQSINLIVTVKDGCMLDWASLDEGTCYTLFMQGLVDGCDTNSEILKLGGHLDDECTQWLLDVQPRTRGGGNWGECAPHCLTWRNYIYDGYSDDPGWCIS